MRTLTYYYSQKDTESPEILKQIQQLCDGLNMPVVDVCIDGNRNLEERFAGKTPVILVGPYSIYHPFEMQEIEIAINATKSLDSDNSQPGEDTRPSKTLEFTRLESFSLWLSHSYVWMISIFLIIFIGTAFLAPLLQLNGQPKIAAGIYKVYSILCHQLTYRSYFIGGEQYAYPREIAGIRGLQTYEAVTGKSAADLTFSRSFIGDAKLGYKVAICQRDVAIYLSLAFFGILFQLTRRKIKGLPWYFWLIFALLPIAIDGGSQLPGLAQGWPAWMPVRESTPLLRTITGTLFGAGTAWYIYPLMEETMSVTRFNLERKLMTIRKLSSKASK